MDALEIDRFYDQPLGFLARRLIGHSIRSYWPQVRGMTVMGLGYPQPYLGFAVENAHAVMGLAPRRMGVGRRHPGIAPALVASDALPFDDNVFDRIVLVHALEHVRDPMAALAEITRTLRGDGRLIVVVANRRGWWARKDNTPFGHGRPYSRSQVHNQLRQAELTPCHDSGALFMLPRPGRIGIRSAMAWERAGRRFLPAFAGVLLIEAIKQKPNIIRPDRVRFRLRQSLPALTTPSPAWRQDQS